MTDTDCVIIVPPDENKPSACVDDDCTPAKKFKQGRLPFKPLDHSGQSPQHGLTPPSSKKRKLSDLESPSAKHLKIAEACQSNKPSLNDCDPEVSSSSEAEPALSGHVKGGKKLNTLDRFFKPKSEPREPEISSTNDSIDLTESMETDGDNDDVEKELEAKKEEHENDVIVCSASSNCMKKLEAFKNTEKKDADPKSSEKNVVKKGAGNKKSEKKIAGKKKNEKKGAVNKKAEKKDAVNKKSDKNDDKKGTDLKTKEKNAIKNDKKDNAGIKTCEKNDKKKDTEDKTQDRNVTKDEKKDTDQNTSKNNETEAEQTSPASPEEVSDDEEDESEKPQVSEKVGSVADSEMSSADLNSSFVSDTSVCEAALKTPAKGSKVESALMKTPVLKRSPSAIKTPGSTATSDGDKTTPASDKRLKLSEKKKKEREEERLRKKAEREQELEEKKKQKEEKEKERLEKKRQKDAEKAEKDKQKQEEKEKREKERLEKLQLKEEEKKVKEKELEAKAEEKKKKEEEKRLKDEEKRKEEEEKAKKAEKKKSMFKGFFIQKDPSDSPPKQKETKNSFFMPFEVKPNMMLAPTERRSPLSVDQKSSLDTLVEQQECSELYVGELKAGTTKPGRSVTTWPRKLGDENDIEILSHEKETIEKVTYRAKFLYFHENTRPAYYGTWNKASSKLSGRNPFKQDEDLFDYEVDSDDEWEEEEPGESVSSDEEEEEGDKNADGEEEEDGWMVPHGYLSDDEGIPDDEQVDNASKQDLQKSKLAAWESELKRQAKALKMLSIGCVWQDNTTEIAAQQLATLLKYKAVCLTGGPIHTSLSQPRNSDMATDKSDQSDEVKQSKKQAKSVPEEAMPDLIRLVHGNPCGIKNLIKEFRFYWRQKTAPKQEEVGETESQGQTAESMEVDDPDEKGSEKSSVTSHENSPSIAKKSGDEFAMSKRQLEFKIPSIAIREKRDKKILWYVKDEVLKQYKMDDVTLPNTWQYVCIKEPLWARERSTPKAEESAANKTSTANKTPSGGRATPNIMQFAQPMMPAQIQALGASLGAKETAKDPIDVVDLTRTPPPPLKPVKTIKQMFSPLSSKERQSKKPAETTGYHPAVASTTSESTVSAGNENQTIASPCASGAASEASLLKVKPISGTPTGKSVDIKGSNDKVVKASPAGRKKSAASIFETVLTSPELMKPSTSVDNAHQAAMDVIWIE